MPATPLLALAMHDADGVVVAPVAVPAKLVREPLAEAGARLRALPKSTTFCHSFALQLHTESAARMYGRGGSDPVATPTAKLYMWCMKM